MGVAGWRPPPGLLSLSAGTDSGNCVTLRGGRDGILPLAPRAFGRLPSAHGQLGCRQGRLELGPVLLE